MSNQTLKPGWKRWRFDQMAINVNDRIDNPAEADVEHYVGLEHLDTDSLKIRRWGAPTDVEATKLRFRKGDIIFGRRRAYQRKLAVADFDGICSAHAMVLRPKTDVVLPEFLPFFMQSDLFMNRALEISVGSLSPTINWKTLATQEFALPPLEEQRRIIELMKAAQEVTESFQNALSQLEICQRIILDDMVLRWQNSVCSVPLVQVLSGSPESGCSAPPRDNPTGHWVLALSALSSHGYIAQELKPVDKTDKMLSALLRPGDLLISRSNTVDRVGFVGIYNGELTGSVSFPDTMMRLNVREDLISNEFLEMVLQSTTLRRRIMSIAAGTSASMKKINRENLLQISLPIPTLSEQQDAAEKRRQFRQAGANLNKRLKQQLNMYGQFLSHSLGGGHC